MALKLIKNTRRTPCSNCKVPHEFITKPVVGRRCDTPVAYPEEVARQVAPMIAHGIEDVVKIPTGTDVTLADNARQLPVREEPGLVMYENVAQHG